MEFPSYENPEISRFWKLTPCGDDPGVSAEGSSTNSPRSVTSRTSTQDGGTGGGFWMMILMIHLGNRSLEWCDNGNCLNMDLFQVSELLPIAIYPDPG